MILMIKIMQFSGVVIIIYLTRTPGVVYFEEGEYLATLRGVKMYLCSVSVL